MRNSQEIFDLLDQEYILYFENHGYQKFIKLKDTFISSNQSDVIFHWYIMNNRSDVVVEIREKGDVSSIWYVISEWREQSETYKIFNDYYEL